MALVGRERLDRAAVEDLALDGAALEHRPLRGLELVEARGEQGPDRRRHDDLAVARLAGHRRHLFEEERVPGRGAADPAAERVVDRREVLEQLVGLVRRERLEQHRGRVRLSARPGRAALEELGPRHAEEQERRVAAEVGDVLDQVEERRLAPVDVIEDDDERPLGRGLLERLPDRPRDLVRRRRRSRAPSSDSIAAAAASSAGLPRAAAAPRPPASR